MFQVVLVDVREGLSRLDVVTNLSVLFKTSSEQVEKLLAVPSFVLKKGLTEEIAGKYKAAIEAAGASCRVEKEKVFEQFLEVDLPPDSLTMSNKQAVEVERTPTFSQYSFGEGDGNLTKAERVNEVNKPNYIGRALGQGFRTRLS